jgi:AcrR family transcriptional regulator
LNVVNEFRGTSRDARKRATAKAVLAAARTEFERVGYEHANLRAIAARAGVSAGTVLHHHGDKRELLHAALFADLEHTLVTAIAELESDAERAFAARLGALTRAMFRYYEARPKLSRALLKESLFADEPWAARFTGQVGRVHIAIVAIARVAIARGELRRGTDPQVLALAYFSFFYFALIAWVQGANADPVALVEHLLQAHLEPR